ncbi:MAG: hypothetical protein ACYDA2_02975 [Acidimicrobiales bacterium]
MNDAAGTLATRWRGQPGRLEVWYATVFDPGSGTGLWVHHELVAPVHGDSRVHGWAALFRTGAAPVCERFGPVSAPDRDAALVLAATTPGAMFDPPRIEGSAGALTWDVRWSAPEDGRPLYTFPRWAWERETLPAAQVVPVASASFGGVIAVGPDVVELSPAARGGVAHIYGHGNAQRWAWLHAELGGGDVLEIVAAVSRRPGLDKLPPLAFVQLRSGGRDWPRDPLAAAPLFRCELDLPRWRVAGTVGRWRLRVEVTVPPEQSVALDYQDPDGAPARCTNSELADAVVVLEHRRARWETAARWELAGCAHAEVGQRPSGPD